MSLSLSKSLSLTYISLVKIEKTSKNSIFSDFVCHFLLFGGVFSKCPFYKKDSFLQEVFFETSLDLRKHPQQVFWIFFWFFKYLFLIFVFIWEIGELRELCEKFRNFWIKIDREIICQSWLLLTPFFNFPIVHCEETIRIKIPLVKRWPCEILNLKQVILRFQC